LNFENQFKVPYLINIISRIFTMFLNLSTQRKHKIDSDVI